MHEQRETIECGNDSVRYEYTTGKVGGAVRSILYEWNRAADGSWYWAIFGGWRVTLAVGGRIGTAKAVAAQHAAYRLAAKDAVDERLAALVAAS